MKSLREYVDNPIRESVDDKLIDNKRYQWMITPKTPKEANIVSAMNLSFSDLFDRKVKRRKLTDKNDFRYIYDALTKNMIEKYGTKHKIDRDTLNTMLPELSEFGHLINDNYDIFTKQYRALKQIVIEKPTPYTQMARDYNAKYGELLPISEVENETLDKGERIVVVRSKFGDGDVLYGVIDKKMTSDLSHQMCAAYRKQTGVPYYEGRPILYTSWLKLPEDRQRASCTEDGKDTENFE